MEKLRAENVSHVFRSSRRDVEALRGISLTVNQGEFVGIVGPSGCGKSTFLRIVAGLVQSTEGCVLLDGREITGPGQDRGMVFQSDGLLPWRTVLDNVALGLQIAGRSQNERQDLSQHFIDLVGLTGFENHYPHELSGGMRQRVNLCRAWAIDPQILLMDEPFASLDAQTREAMQVELLRIWERSKKTVLFITHQIEEAAFLADRVIVFSGRPGVVKTELKIDFRRPRELGMKRTGQFGEIVDTVWQFLEKDIWKVAKDDI